MKPTNFIAIFKTFVQHEVDFIVVGGLSAVLNGAPILTFDADIVHSRQPKNFDPMLAALKEMDATYRYPSGSKAFPKISHLASKGHQLLRTIHGDLDLLGTVDAGLSYEDLEPHSTWMEIELGVNVRNLNLDKYVEMKEKLNRDKDRAVLPTLRAALAEQKKRQQ